MDFEASDIIGKTLYAKTRVPLKRTAWDDEPVTGYAEPGQAVGVVHTWVDPRPGRKNLWWAFVASNGSWYYTEHIGGRYDLDKLRDQGVKTIQEKVEDAKPLAEKITDKLAKTVITAAFVYAGGRIIMQAIR